MKENIQKLVDTLLDADDIYNQIPFSTDSTGLKYAISLAIMSARKLDSDPQAGQSLEEFIQEMRRDIVRA